MRDARLVQRGLPVKILGDGELTVALTVEADSFSKAARAKIEAAGGTLRWIGGEPQAEEAPADDADVPKKPGRVKANAEPQAEPEAKEETSDGTGS
jgi:hypothetical protein